jgi:T5orf172 domain
MEPSSVSAQMLSAKSVAIKNDEGFIYVLRNAAHQIDIFKIGLTRRDVAVRAAELSRGTGIPDIFLTVQEWLVPDVVYAEKRIHQLLNDYRLKDAREFFRADYTVIRSVVELVVNELAGKSIPSK